MPEDGKGPSWSQRDGRKAQREHQRANSRARRMRRQLNSTETRLWKALRVLNREGFHFRRQPAIGPLVFDVGDLARRLPIETDGGVHERFVEVAARDAEKSRWAAANGSTLLRIANARVWGDIGDVMSTIRQLAADPHPLPPPHKGEGKS